MSTIQFRNILAATVALGAITLTGIGVADDSSKPPIWQRTSVRKPSLPKILTKPAKVQTELPPKEAANACLATAKDLFDQGYDREATLLFERARQLDPKHANVCRFLAVLYDRQNDTGRAKTEYDQALKLAPKDADLLNDVGYFYYRRAQWKEAESKFREALAQNPKLERAKINLGMTLGHQGRMQDAYELFAEAVGPAAAHSNVGILLAKQGHRAEAIDALHKSLAFDPDLGQAKACLACLEKPAQTAQLASGPVGQPPSRSQASQTPSGQPSLNGQNLAGGHPLAVQQ